jgi:hypothetical protein
MSGGLPLVGPVQRRADMIELCYLLDVLDTYDARIALAPDEMIQRHYRAHHLAAMRLRVPVLAESLTYSARVMADAEIWHQVERPASWAQHPPLARALRLAMLITYPDRLEELLCRAAS